MIGGAQEKRNRRDRMRRLLIGLLVASAIGASNSRASAADLPMLRGSDTFVPAFAECCSRFAGIYAGGQVGVGVTSVDFWQGTQSVIAQMLQVTALQNEAAVSTWQVLGHTDTRGRSWGGFIGYIWRERASSSALRSITAVPIFNLKRMPRRSRES